MADPDGDAVQVDPVDDYHGAISPVDTDNGGVEDHDDGIIRDTFGFEIDPEIADESAAFISTYMQTQQRRAPRWNAFLEKHSPEVPRNNQLKKLVRKGIPWQHRKRLWKALAASDVRQAHHPDYYYEILSRAQAHEATEHTNQIDRDVPRTFAGHHLLGTPDSINKMRNILYAFVERNPAVGYCQGMNYFVAVSLLFLDEEEGFWLLVCLVEDILPERYYDPSMRDSRIDQYVFLDLLASKVPKVYKVLETNDLLDQLVIFSHQWFLTLFINSCPIETSLRVVDCVLAEGSKVLFRIAIALFKANERAFTRAGADMGELIQLIQVMPRRAINCETLLKTGFDKIGSLSNKKIGKLRQQHLITVNNMGGGGASSSTCNDE